MTVSKRAMSDAQKSERRLTILEAARALFQTKSFQEVSMAAVAEKAGLAKGTVFLYFKTKEILFLGLIAEEFDAVFGALDVELVALTSQGRGTATRMKTLLQEALVRVFRERRLFVRLLAIQHVVLEHNITYREAKTFKTRLTERVRHTGVLMEQSIEFFAEGDGVRFVMWMYAFAIGFFHAAEPSPMIRRVYQRNPAIREFQIDFATEFFRAIDAVLSGMEVEAATRKRENPS